MTKQLIQKNIKLSLEFDSYVVDNPRILRFIPAGTNIIITSAVDKKLSDANLTIARESKSEKFMEAHKSGKGWKIRKVKP